MPRSAVSFFTPMPLRLSARSRSTSNPTTSICSASRHISFTGLKGSALFTSAGAIPRFGSSLWLDGGGHERGLRSGTVAVPLVVGLGVAVELAVRERPDEAIRLLELRERLHAGIAARVPAVRLNGPPADRLPGNLNLSFADVDGEALMMAMRDVAVSSGSACSSTNPEPSQVLLAMGLDEDSARASLRFGLGRFTTAEEIDFAIEAVAASRRTASPQECCLDGSGWGMI